MNREEIQNNREEIQNNIGRLNSELAVWCGHMTKFENDPLNNVFDTLDEAEQTIQDELYSLSSSADEESYSCGMDEYSKQFYVGKVLYTGTSTFEYNRHHKFKVSFVTQDNNITDV